MRAIAKAEGFKVEFKDLPFPSLIPALSTGKIDILVTGLTVTEKRSKVIDFTISLVGNQRRDPGAQRLGSEYCHRRVLRRQDRGAGGLVTTGLDGSKCRKAGKGRCK